MTIEYRYVVFNMVDKKPKTEVYDVNTKSGDFIGLIQWYAPWRQYCFFPANDTIWSRGCMNQIVEFIHNLMDGRKK